jgi:hypothetical protein
MSELWTQVLGRLADELPEQQVNTWLHPLQAVEEDGQLRLLAPNRAGSCSNTPRRIAALLRKGHAGGGGSGFKPLPAPLRQATRQRPACLPNPRCRLA